MKDRFGDVGSEIDEESSGGDGIGGVDAVSVKESRGVIFSQDVLPDEATDGLRDLGSSTVGGEEGDVLMKRSQFDGS
jgi:hypothetical protein